MHSRSIPKQTESTSPVDLLERYTASDEDTALERAEAFASDTIYTTFMSPLTVIHGKLTVIHGKLHEQNIEGSPFSIGRNSKPGRRERRLLWDRPMHGSVSVTCIVSGHSPCLVIGALEERVVVNAPRPGRRFIGGVQNIERLVALARDLSAALPIEQNDDLRRLLAPSFLSSSVETANNARARVVQDINDLAILLHDRCIAAGWVGRALARATDDRAPDDEDRWDESDPEDYHSLAEAIAIEGNSGHVSRIHLLAGVPVDMSFTSPTTPPAISLPNFRGGGEIDDPGIGKMYLEGARRALLRCLVSLSTYTPDEPELDGWKMVSLPEDARSEELWIKAYLADPAPLAHPRTPQP